MAFIIFPGRNNNTAANKNATLKMILNFKREKNH